MSIDDYLECECGHPRHTMKKAVKAVHGGKVRNVYKLDGHILNALVHKLKLVRIGERTICVKCKDICLHSELLGIRFTNKGIVS